MSFLVNQDGYYGEFGGAYVPEILHKCVEELQNTYLNVLQSEDFKQEFDQLLRDYVGRPSPLYYARRLSEKYGCKLYLKREDLNHTGAHKINNTIGQILLARRMGKHRIIAETGAGQHGVATATVCALMNMECIVYMGKTDVERQHVNVEKMKMLGATVIPVTSGNMTLKDATNEAIRDWCCHPADTYYIIGSTVGPHPYPDMVARLQSVISEEIKKQLIEKEGRDCPDYLIACVGGGSNAAGTIYHYIDDSRVQIVLAEAGGKGIDTGMTAATIIMHKGINTGAVFGHVFDFTGLPVVARVILALLVCIVLCTVFTTIAGFFTAKFKMHPFISTMANMLVIFGLVTYSTKGVSFGGIEGNIPSMIIPKIGGFPTIILWAIAAVIIVWFIWNKTTFGKNLFAVGGNAEAAAVSGISVFRVTVGAFILAGILYGFGSWLECIRMVGSGSAAYGQGWELDALAACVVGGVSFTGGIGKISGVVVGVFIFTALTYSLTTLGIDTNLQFVFSGIIILVAVMLDCLKYVQKK